MAASPSAVEVRGCGEERAVLRPEMAARRWVWAGVVRGEGVRRVRWEAERASMACMRYSHCRGFGLAGSGCIRGGVPELLFILKMG